MLPVKMELRICIAGVTAILQMRFTENTLILQNNKNTFHGTMPLSAFYRCLAWKVILLHWGSR